MPCAIRSPSTGVLRSGADCKRRQARGIHPLKPDAHNGMMKIKENVATQCRCHTHDTTYMAYIASIRACPYAYTQGTVQRARGQPRARRTLARTFLHIKGMLNIALKFKSAPAMNTAPNVYALVAGSQRMTVPEMSSTITW